MLNITQIKETITITELWLPVIGFKKQYQVSNYGRVRNSSNLVMKTYFNNSNYECIQFRVLGKRTHKLVHRLVAEAFCLHKLLDMKEVNHIDGNKYNNYSSNLEWCTSSDNKLHAFKLGLRSKESCISTLGTKHKSTSSKYYNVSWDKARNKWIGSIRHEGKTHFQKRFINEDAAALHVNWIIKELGLIDRPINIV